MKKFFVVFFFVFASPLFADEVTTNIWMKDFEYRSNPLSVSLYEDFELSPMAEKLLEDERKFRSVVAPSYLRGLVVVLVFINAYNDETWRQPGPMSGGVNKDRIRVGDTILIHRKGSARGFVWKSETLGDQTELLFPAIVRDKLAMVACLRF